MANERFKIYWTRAWWDLIDMHPGESMEPHPVATISTRIEDAERKIRALAAELNGVPPVDVILAQMITVKAWGTAYYPAKAYTVNLNTTGMDIQLVKYENLDWPSEEHAKYAREAAESARRVIIDQFTERFLAMSRV